MRSRWILVLVTAILLTSGCIAGNHGNTPDNPAQGNDMAAIDAALANGPVFVEFTMAGSDAAAQEKPVIDDLKAEYPGVTFMEVDIDDNGRLAYLFYVEDIPQMDVIVKKNPDGSYVYVSLGGGTTDDRKSSAIVGYHEKADLEKTIDAAVKARG